MNTRVEVTVRVVPEDASLPTTVGYWEYTSKDEYITRYMQDVRGAAYVALLQALSARGTMVETK